MADDTKPAAPATPKPPAEKFPITEATVLRGKTDPEGRVKQQDAQGNFLADEKDPKTLETIAQAKADAEAARVAALPPTVGSGTPVTNEQQLHAQALADKTSGQSAAVRSGATQIKLKELETRLKAESDSKSAKATMNRALLRSQIQELKERESRRFSGGDLMLPKNMLLLAPEAQDKNPDLKLRWVNENVAGRADMLRGMGYRKLSEEEGGQTRGELALYGIPMDAWAKGNAAKIVRSSKATENFGKEFRELGEELMARIEERYGKKLSLIDEEG